MLPKLVQLTLIQLDNYGPWTGTLGNDREHRLQILQSDLYSAIEQRFAELNGLAFFNRFDEMLAVSNGITEEDHRKIQQSVQQEFSVTFSMGIGVAENPFQAQLKASRLLQQKGSAQSPTRHSVLACDGTAELTQCQVQLAHLDVDGITEALTDKSSAFETSLYVMTLYVELMRLFREQEALLFYLGGDNFMGVANGMSYKQIDSFLSRYRSRDVKLKCGIGVARTARKAAELAAMNLDEIRNGNGENPILATAKL